MTDDLTVLPPPAVLQTLTVILSVADPEQGDSLLFGCSPRSLRSSARDFHAATSASLAAKSLCSLCAGEAFLEVGPLEHWFCGMFVDTMEKYHYLGCAGLNRIYYRTRVLNSVQMCIFNGGRKYYGTC